VKRVNDESKSKSVRHSLHFLPLATCSAQSAFPLSVIHYCHLYYNLKEMSEWTALSPKSHGRSLTSRRIPSSSSSSGSSSEHSDDDREHGQSRSCSPKGEGSQSAIDDTVTPPLITVDAFLRVGGSKFKPPTRTYGKAGRRSARASTLHDTHTPTPISPPATLKPTSTISPQSKPRRKYRTARRINDDPTQSDFLLNHVVEKPKPVPSPPKSRARPPKTISSRTPRSSSASPTKPSRSRDASAPDRPPPLSFVSLTEHTEAYKQLRSSR
jgi:hypothetical protein